ncbi:MAG TPA: hypothetical protein VM911_16335 [Pyrinomonadaceae bacterium]|nr:hypothetical protein [Pyrinomonadaceae bacterium]
MRLLKHLRHPRLLLAFGAALLALAGLSLLTTGDTFAASLWPTAVQQSFPSPPADRTLVYIEDVNKGLAPLPFEAGVLPINTNEVAKSDRTSYIELKGAIAATTINTIAPHLYVFVPERPDEHPPFLVRLTEKRGVRRVRAMTQKGLRGYAIASEDIIKPHYRVLGRAEGGMVYMEIRPRVPLEEGEYAIVGTDLQRIATFRVAFATKP